MHEVAGHQAPFTVYYSLAVPGQARLQTRTERQRYVSKVSRLLYNTLATNVSLNVARPGGGTHSGLDIYAFTDILGGMQHKPQFGETPAQLVLPGFYVVSTNLVQNYPNKNDVLDNRFLPGPMGGQFPAAVTIPVSSITTEVKALKTILDAAAATVLATYPDCALRTFRLDYKKIIFGDRGFTFPN